MSSRFARSLALAALLSLFGAASARADDAGDVAAFYGNRHALPSLRLTSPDAVGDPIKGIAPSRLQNKTKKKQDQMKGKYLSE